MANDSNERQKKVWELILSWLGTQGRLVSHEKMRAICNTGKRIAEGVPAPQNQEGGDIKKFSYALYEYLYPLVRAGIVELKTEDSKIFWGLAPACVFFRDDGGKRFWTGINLSDAQKGSIQGTMCFDYLNISEWITGTDITEDGLPVVKNPSTLALLRLFKPCKPEVFGVRDPGINWEKYSEVFIYGKGWQQARFRERAGLYRVKGLYSNRAYRDKSGIGYRINRFPENNFWAKLRANMDNGKDVATYNSREQKLVFWQDLPFLLARVLFLEQLSRGVFPKMNGTYYGISQEHIRELNRIFEGKIKIEND